MQTLHNWPKLRKAGTRKQRELSQADLNGFCRGKAVEPYKGRMMRKAYVTHE